eukprot:scaffold27355_cov135-Isochrysis_galbana.AAC.7
MHSTDNYLPETGRGVLVIKRIPPGPPDMAKFAPKKEWALDKKLISTVVKFSKFSVKVLDRLRSAQVRGPLADGD